MEQQPNSCLVPLQFMVHYQAQAQRKEWARSPEEQDHLWIKAAESNL